MNCDGIIKLIRGENLNSVSLGRILGCSHSTAMHRIRNPKEFTLEELERIIKHTDLTLSQVKEAIV